MPIARQATHYTMESLLGALLAYLISLAANERTAATHKRREAELREELAKDKALQDAMKSMAPLGDAVTEAMTQIARNRATLGMCTPYEERLIELFSDSTFQSEVVEWLMAGGISEGASAREALRSRIAEALASGGATPQQLEFLRERYFDLIEKEVFSNSLLAHWRHQLSLDYLRAQVAELKTNAEEAAGIYSAAKQQTAIDEYCALALKAWDIIDLSNLPEGDVNIATQALLLRQLYVPLRVRVEVEKNAEVDAEKALGEIEQRRARFRRWEAGRIHVVPDKDDASSRRRRFAVGERVAAAQRLVVLGDPGGGKTTMLRWMATAYLLRRGGDVAFDRLPDTQSLPQKNWIPVLIRCRDLGEADLCRSFNEFLTQHLSKTELKPEQLDVVKAAIFGSLARGEALLLVDGLDEITNPRVRVLFCQELERTAARYPDAPIIVTSRIVGYRDMPYRMGGAFEHAVIANLTKDDKDLFARRWVDVTEQQRTKEEKDRRVEELTEALHSTDRIERLTGNPMLLTTLALVKRKVGRLPNRRIDLYREAVFVLLNWNIIPGLYEAIEEREAIPQLEYTAYEMCRLGVQQLSEDQVLELFDRVRHEYPNVRAIRNRDAKEFLSLLEARSSMLIEAGNLWSDQTEEAVYEFRHLTFQEYLAARALLDGRYPGRDKSKSLAEQIAPLAKGIHVTDESGGALPEAVDTYEVPEAWREALRLCIAGCADDIVDDAVLAILTPTPEEEEPAASRPRAIIAGLCLADEPNVSEKTAEAVLKSFASHAAPGDGMGHVTTALDAAAVEIGASLWAPMLQRFLIDEFIQREPNHRWYAGGLWAMVETRRIPKDTAAKSRWFTELIQRLRSPDARQATSAALVVMEAAFEGKAAVTNEIVAQLFDLLATGEPPARHASAWALGWLASDRPLPHTDREEPAWKASPEEVVRIVTELRRTALEEVGTLRFLMMSLRRTDDDCAVAVLVDLTAHNDSDIRGSAIDALSTFTPRAHAVSAITERLSDSNTEVRRSAMAAAGAWKLEEVVDRLAQALSSSSDRTEQIAAATALGRINNNSARSTLLVLLRADTSPLRQMAVAGLAQPLGSRERELLSRDFDAAEPWLDPQKPITASRIAAAAAKLKVSSAEVRGMYEQLAPTFQLSFAD